MMVIIIIVLRTSFLVCRTMAWCFSQKIHKKRTDSEVRGIYLLSNSSIKISLAVLTAAESRRLFCVNHNLSAGSTLPQSVFFFRATALWLF